MTEIVQKRLTSGPPTNIGRKLDIAPLEKQMKKMNERLLNMEEKYNVSIAGNSVTSETSEEHIETQTMTRQIGNAGGQALNEDWFWTEDAYEEEALSFSSSDGFAVNSIVCRSEWCRVEVEDYEGDGSLVSDLELQLKINESLGRDTVIRSGNRSGNSRVLFIK